jgi:hypothetical protein
MTGKRAVRALAGARRVFMDTVRRQGFADGYSGLQVAQSGRRFWIKETTV